MTLAMTPCWWQLRHPPGVAEEIRDVCEDLTSEFEVSRMCGHLHVRAPVLFPGLGCLAAFGAGCGKPRHPGPYGAPHAPHAPHAPCVIDDRSQASIVDAFAEPEGTDGDAIKEVPGLRWDPGEGQG